MHFGASPIIFERARQLRRCMTESELKLWSELRNKKLMDLKFRRQHPALTFILDFYCHELKLAIEIDGKYHNSTKQKLLDKSRTGDLQDCGITIIRFTNEQVNDCLHEVVSEIKSTVARIR